MWRWFYRTLLVFFLSFAFFLGRAPRSVLAAQPGINIGAHHSEFDQAARLVGPGGWVVVMATPGDCPWLSQMIKTHNVNVIIRGHYPGQQFSGQNGKNWAVSWAYTLASMDTGGKKVFFMPLNEPNQTGSGDYQSPSTVVSYTNELINQFNKLGIRESKVKLLSPMFNSNRPDVASYINQLLGIEPNFFQKFDGISMNMYDVEDHPGDVFSKGDQVPVTNVARYSSLLNLYRAPNKPVYGVEAGVFSGGVVYNDEYLAPFVQAAIDRLPSVMFAVFSYDPEHHQQWNIFASKTADVYRRNQGKGRLVTGASGSQDINQLLQKAKSEGLNLVKCHPQGCGLATSTNYCESHGGGTSLVSGDVTQPRIEPVQGDIASAISDPVRLIQKEELKYPETGPRKVSRGLFLEQFGGITVPYARSIAQFLGGDLIYNGGQSNPSVLSKLLTLRQKDTLRAKYWLNCKNGVYCNGQINDPKRCPNQANECVVFTDKGMLNITDIPLKPLIQNYSNRKAYIQALNDWLQKPNTEYWKEIPLFANPVTQVMGALSVDSCPSFTDQGSTVHTKFPWLKALLDVSKVLNDVLVPKRNGADISESSTTKIASNLPLPTEEKPVSKDTSLLADSQSEDDCSQMGKIFWANIKPLNVRQVYGGLSVCWQFEAGSNDPNYSVGDWGLVVYASVGETTKSRYSPMLGGANNVIGKGHTVHLECTYGTFGGPFFFPGVTSINQVKLSFQITGGRCKGTLCGKCDYRNFINSGSGHPVESVCRPPGHPTPRLIADPHPVPVEIEGHQRLRGPGKKLYCNKWVPTGKTYIDGNGNRVPVMECKDGRTSYNVSDPLWVYLYYPYLNSIAANLVYKERGVFRIFVSDEAETAHWFDAGTSNISFCASIYDDVLRGHFLAEGLPIEEVNSFKSDVMHNVALAPWPPSTPYFSSRNGHPNQGQCAANDSVENVKLYPPYLGGIMNAVDLVSQCLTIDNHAPFCKK